MNYLTLKTAESSNLFPFLPAKIQRIPNLKNYYQDKVNLCP